MSATEPNPSNSQALAVDRPIHAWMLAAIAGSADAICFLLYDAFAGQMTGNTVLLAIDVLKFDWWNGARHLGIIACFGIGVFGAAVALRNAISPAIVLVASALMLAAAVTLPGNSPALLVAVAMGLQNAGARRFGSLTLNTVIVTGDLQSVVTSLTTRNAKPTDKLAGRTLALLWAAYLAGAVCGAFLTRATSYPLLVPALAMVPVILVGTSWWRRRANLR